MQELQILKFCHARTKTTFEVHVILDLGIFMKITKVLQKLKFEMYRW